MNLEHGGNTGFVLVVFATVYLGMLLGRLPGMQLDRTGVALLGALALVGTGVMEPQAAVAAIDVPTLALLFGLMIVSVQLRLGGFYTRITGWLQFRAAGPRGLLALVMATSAALAAVFTNDIVCLAVAPVVVDLCRRRALAPIPFLLALACAANVGSAATLIGNPQNILIGQRLELSFTGYMATALVPTLLGLLATWAIICLQYRGRWHQRGTVVARVDVEQPPFDVWQSVKGLAVTAALIVVFVTALWPRELAALAAAAVLLCSRRLHSREVLGLVDWQLLVLFAGLFIVNHAFEHTGLATRAVAAAADTGIDLGNAMWLTLVATLLGNAVSNVPAVMILLPHVNGDTGGALLALSSTFAGNLLIVGSIANIIVADAARRAGIAMDWRAHARTGVPVTIATLAILLTCHALTG